MPVDITCWRPNPFDSPARAAVEAVIAELMDCLPFAQKRRGRDRSECLEALNNLVRDYRNNAQRMKYRLFREHHFAIGSGAIESAHRHVLQTRPVAVHGAIRRARRAPVEHGALVRPRAAFRYSRQGKRALASAARAASDGSYAPLLPEVGRGHPGPARKVVQ